MQPAARGLRRTGMTIRRVPRLLSAAACAAVVLAGCGTQHAGPQPGAARAPGSSPHQRAVADAARILASFPPPPGAVRTGLIASLTGPGEGPEATPDVVTATRWWRAPGQPQAVLAWVRGHMPAGFTLGGTGHGAFMPSPSVVVPESWTDQFELPVVPGVLTQRWLVVLVVPYRGDQTAIRVDAQVVWLPARPAAERIPPDARAVTLAPVFGFGARKNLERLDPTVTVTDPAKVARIAAVIDGLALFPAGAFSCPAESGAAMRLTFRASPGGPVLAQLSAQYGGCGIVSVSIGGRSMPALSDGTESGQQLPARALAIAGARWAYPLGGPT